MRIAIRTDSDTTELKLLSEAGETLAQDRWESGRQLSNQLLDHIESLLQHNRATWNDLSGVIVFRGPGSFTGLRIGVAVANAIAYAQTIPIAGTTGEDWVGGGLTRLSRGTNDVQVVPHYGAKPHITKPGKPS